MITLNGWEVKVGDKLWSVMHGEFGRVVRIKDYIELQFASLSTGFFGLDGSYFKDGPQVLFWDKVEIVPPPKSRRKVKKYRALLRFGDNFGISPGSFATLEEAKQTYRCAYEAQNLILETEQEFEE